MVAMLKLQLYVTYAGKKKIIKYQDYYKSLQSHGIYTCSDCSHLKTKLTCLELYGGVSSLSNPEIRAKGKATILKKYGVENVFDSNAPSFIKEKIKKTMLEKYGVENIFQDIDYIKQKNVEKYGVPHHFKLESQKEKYLYGDKRWNYNHSLTLEERVHKRLLPEYTRWRNKVYERDNYTCKICGYDKGGILQAHHIYSYNLYPMYRYDVNNGITLCKKCHKKFHEMYGYGDNTLDQFILFLLYMLIEGQTTISPESTPEDELPVEAQNIH